MFFLRSTSCRFRHSPRTAWSTQRKSLSLAGRIRPSRSWIIYSTCAILLGAAYSNSQQFRHTVLAVVRCSRIAGAAVVSAIDYKFTSAKKYNSVDQEAAAFSNCHKRNANRVLTALLANGGIFIKMGQHMASLIVLPVEWTTTMKILQDRCDPTKYEDLKSLFLNDIGKPIEELFHFFDPNPIGVASLAQVHVGHLRSSDKLVAVKLQHPHLSEFCDVDMKMVDVTLGWVKYWFPEFEFSWLAEEMRQNLPKEMNFIQESENAARTSADFIAVRTSLYIPEVILASKRVLIMEYIQGGRVDDLVYLANCKIDRNKVALELSRIFNQMVFVNGWFHADPHHGNLLIRPAPLESRSPFNFEIVLLDHGLYFDIDAKLRIDYSKLWLSLIAPASPSTMADRRKYAELVGNIGPDLYPVFEAAITGRMDLEGSQDKANNSSLNQTSSIIEMAPQSTEEKDAIRDAVINREGVLLSVFDVLRRIPRRVLMVLKLNDLTRSLDHSLMTTHSNIRIFLITAKYCVYAVWRDDRKHLVDEMSVRKSFSSSYLLNYFLCWLKYMTAYTKLYLLESFMDFAADVLKKKAWARGLWFEGFTGASVWLRTWHIQNYIIYLNHSCILLLKSSRRNLGREDCAGDRTAHEEFGLIHAQ